MSPTGHRATLGFGTKTSLLFCVKPILMSLSDRDIARRAHARIAGLPVVAADATTFAVANQQFLMEGILP
jgi:hypothetical protein